MVKHGAVCGTSGRPGSEESLESMRGTLSKCEFRGTEMVDKDEINDEMTSGDVGSVEELEAWPRPPGRDLRRRRRLSKAESACLGGAGKGSLRCMAFNSSSRLRDGITRPRVLGGQTRGRKINERCRERVEWPRAYSGCSSTASMDNCRFGLCPRRNWKREGRKPSLFDRFALALVTTPLLGRRLTAGGETDKKNSRRVEKSNGRGRDNRRWRIRKERRGWRESERVVERRGE